MVQPAAKRVKLSDTENTDRLGDLPDCVILHIFSFLNAKHAVQTCVLSPRWKDLWKRLPAFILHSSDFPTLKIFTKFVSRLLSLHDSSISLQALDFNRHGCMEPQLLKRIVNYAISHNVQRLGLSVQCHIEKIPHTIFSCRTLTYLKLSVYPSIGFGEKTFFPKSLDLPALTTLHLVNFDFYASDNNELVEPFSVFNKLNSLVLDSCGVRVATTLFISNAALVCFTLHNHSYDFFKIELCTPCLRNFAFIGIPYQRLLGSDLSSVKHVDIDADIFSKEKHPSLFLLSWLLVLSTTKSLTVTATTLQILSLYPDILKMKLPSLGMLKLLKVKSKPLEYGFRMTLLEFKLEKVKSKKEAAKLKKAYKEGLEPSSPIPDGIVNFLIENSPSAEVEIIDCSWRKEKSSS